jgi:GTPase SAR1 family protein
MRILMVGLDAAGKTTILYKLKLGEGERLASEHRHWVQAWNRLVVLLFGWNVMEVSSPL